MALVLALRKLFTGGSGLTLITIVGILVLGIVASQPDNHVEEPDGPVLIKDERSTEIKLNESNDS